MRVPGFFGKALIETDSGSLRLVKIEPQSAYPVHRHPDKTEFAFVLQGVLQAEIAGEVYTGERGTFYRFPCGSLHGLKNPGQEETIVLIGGLKERETERG
jgi:quercetin dioxygenase-like cupin family protein